MDLVRAYSTLYDLVGRNCQDEATTGDTLAKEAIVQTVQEISRDFKIPWQIRGRTGNQTLSLTATAGPASISPLQTDIQHISRIYYALNGVIFDLERIESEEEWLEKTDSDSTGDPIYYKDYEMGETGTAGTREIVVWPGPSSSFISLYTNLKIIYYAQLQAPSADADIIRLPREHEPLVIYGGTMHMAEKQGDSVILGIYLPLYEQAKTKFRASITHERNDSDVVIGPAHPYGLYGSSRSGYGSDYGLRG